jgi:hypothetical protein
MPAQPIPIISIMGRNVCAAILAARFRIASIVATV